jgi:hypothetical protein
MASQPTHGWSFEKAKDGDNPALRCTKDGRPTVYIVGEVGIAPDVLREYALTRALEVDVANGEDGAADRLDHQVRQSRANQAARESARYAASMAGGDDE